MVASKKSKDSESRKILTHSIVGTFLAGLMFSGVMAAIGKDILSLTKLWQPYGTFLFVQVILTCLLLVDVFFFKKQ